MAVDPPRREVSRLGFIADLSFLLCVVWLALWRVELFDAPHGSIWASRWPAIALAGLVAAALTAGLLQQRPRGFLPYALRWVFLAASLVLPAWIGLSLADLRPPAALAMRSVATELRQDTERALAQDSAPETKKQAEATRETTEAIDKLASVVEQASAQGIEIPEKDLSLFGIEAAELAEVEPADKEMLEQALGLASMVDKRQAPSPELSETLRDNGMDDRMLKMALIGIAAAVIAPALGLSPALVEAILAALAIDGGFSMENIAQVALAVGMSRTKAGNFSATKFKKNYKMLGDSAKVFHKFVDAVEAKAGPEFQRSEAFKAIREVTRDEKQPSLTPACNRALDDARKGTTNTNAQDLKRACPDFSPRELERLVGGRP